MKRKILSIFLMIAVFLSINFTASATSENLSTYTASNANFAVSDGGNLVTATNMNREGTASYFYKDFGVDWHDSQSFILTFTTQFMTSNQYGGCHLATMASGYGALPTTYAGHGFEIRVDYRTTTTFNIQLYRMRYGVTTSQAVAVSSDLPIGTYYFKEVFDANVGTYGTMQILMDNNSDFSSPEYNKTMTLDNAVGNDIRYLQPVTDGRIGAAGYYCTVKVSNFEISMGAGLPSVITLDNAIVDYDPINEVYEVILSANLTSSGSDICYVYILSSSDGVNYDLNNTYNTGDNIYQANLFYPLGYRGQTRYFYAWAVNEYGESEGTEYTFTIEDSEIDIPTVNTITPPTSISGGSATIHGTLWDDGGENCTGYFMYKAITAENWTASTNTTDLISGMSFYYEITGLPEDIYFIYYAVAENSQGVDNGTSSYFIWNNATMPTCNTLPATNILELSIPEDSYRATFNGNIANDGGGYCVVGFDYRESGYDEYTRYEKGGEYTTGANFTYTLYGLSQMTTYEYRAIVSNQAGYNDIYEYYTYNTGDWLSFNTGSSLGLPTITLDGVGYFNNNTVTCNMTLTNDGGSSCIINLQYSKGGSPYTNASTPDISPCTTGNQYQSYITGLEYGETYRIRAYAYNTIEGGIGISNYIDFTLVTPEEAETEPIIDIGDGAETILDLFKLNTRSGKLTLLIIGMCIVLVVGVFASLLYNKYMGISLLIVALVESGLLTYGMVNNLLPTGAIVVFLVVFAVIGSIYIVKLLTGRSNGGEI